jgi:hypothetical protein
MVDLMQDLMWWHRKFQLLLEANTGAYLGWTSSGLRFDLDVDYTISGWGWSYVRGFFSTCLKVHLFNVDCSRRHPLAAPLPRA